MYPLLENYRIVCNDASSVIDSKPMLLLSVTVLDYNKITLADYEIIYRFANIRDVTILYVSLWCNLNGIRYNRSSLTFFGF